MRKPYYYYSEPPRPIQLAYKHLHAGRYEQGFKLYEYRWHEDIIKNEPSPTRPALKMPVWQGESLLGKTITVQVEQGFGDIIMFARFLPALKALGAAKVVVLQESTLHYLLGQIEAVDVFTNETDKGVATESDYWIGMMSLPYYLSLAHPLIKNLFPVTTKKIVASEGYLHAIPSNIPSKIGVNWEASKQILYYIKSIDMKLMEELVGNDAYSLNPKPMVYLTLCLTMVGKPIGIRLQAT